MSAETVKQFYRKWYDLHNMAVVAVGDFSDTQVCFISLKCFCIEITREWFDLKISNGDPTYSERG